MDSKTKAGMQQNLFHHQSCQSCHTIVTCDVTAFTSTKPKAQWHTALQHVRQLMHSPAGIHNVKILSYYFHRTGSQTKHKAALTLNCMQYEANTTLPSPL